MNRGFYPPLQTRLVGKGLSAGVGSVSTDGGAPVDGRLLVETDCRAPWNDAR